MSQEFASDRPAADWLLCTICGKYVHISDWWGECPDCGNGTMKEMEHGPE